MGESENRDERLEHYVRASQNLSQWSGLWYWVGLLAMPLAGVMWGLGVPWWLAAGAGAIAMWHGFKQGRTMRYAAKVARASYEVVRMYPELTEEEVIATAEHFVQAGFVRG